MLKGIRSVELVANLVLHLPVGEVVSGYFSGQEDHHHIESAVISVELPGGLHRGLPVLKALVEVVLAELLADVLEL
jgi:hypothetical protein